MFHFSNYIEKTFGCCTNTFIICDLDGTLVHTDKANWYAYRQALLSVTNRDLLSYKVQGRATRETIKDSGAFDDLSFEQITEIIRCKQSYFERYLSEIVVEKDLIESIKELHNAGSQIILATTAEQRRAELLLQYLQISNCFSHKVFKETMGNIQNKFRYIIEQYCNDPNRIFIIENEYNERNKAIRCGIPPQNFLCKQYEICCNQFLTQNTVAFFQMDYGRYRTINNPIFINILKNQDCRIPNNELNRAQDELKKILYHDLLQMYYSNERKAFVVCVVPRAKHENWYCDVQKLFRKSVSEVVERLFAEGIPVENGTQYIIRLKDTPTTHCGETYENGNKTYIGITNSTCEISPNIQGKSILLIDDIYTKNVNIDEDAIQSLYDKGAKKVIFYSVAKTPKT